MKTSLPWITEAMRAALIIALVTAAWIGAAALAQYFQGVRLVLLP